MFCWNNIILKMLAKEENYNKDTCYYTEKILY